MIGMIASWLIARNPAMTLPYARRLAKTITIVAAIALAVGGFVVWDWWDDRQAVQQAELKRAAAEAQKALEAEQRANEAAQARDAARNAAHDTTKRELEEIHNEDPDAAKAPAARGSRAVADRIPVQR